MSAVPSQFALVSDREAGRGKSTKEHKRGQNMIECCKYTTTCVHFGCEPFCTWYFLHASLFYGVYTTCVIHAYSRLSSTCTCTLHVLTLHSGHFLALLAQCLHTVE